MLTAQVPKKAVTSKQSTNHRISFIFVETPFGEARCPKVAHLRDQRKHSPIIVLAWLPVGGLTFHCLSASAHPPAAGRENPRSGATRSPSAFSSRRRSRSAARSTVADPNRQRPPQVNLFSDPTRARVDVHHFAQRIVQERCGHWRPGADGVSVGPKPAGRPVAGRSSESRTNSTPLEFGRGPRG
jgi:hypothetical protein